jgi:hypothetical protein
MVIAMIASLKSGAKTWVAHREGEGKERVRKQGLDACADLG